MKKQYFYLSIISLILLIPSFIFADGGMIYWPPDVYLDQSAQNAIVAWNGKQEIIILSNDVKSDAQATVLRIVPLPSNPSEIKEGSFDFFEKLVEIMNKKLDKIREEFRALGKGAKAPAPGIEITFQKKIGAHDITVVKVSDLSVFLDWVTEFATEKGLKVKEVSSQFKEGVKNYLKRDIKYFVFDIIDTKGEESIKPIIYKFDSDYLYYPVLISGISEISESRAKIRVFFISKEKISDRKYWHPFWQGYFGYPIELTLEELKEINEDVANLFNSNVKVITFDYYNFLKDFKKDLIFYPQIWQRNLGIGNFGEDVKALQKILINEGYWDSEVGATGYFGQITKRAVEKFQEENKHYVLQPLELERGTGFFGSKTREYLENGTYVLETERKWKRNLFLGIKGDDVKALQEILIEEGVWPRLDVKPTGYFGLITKEAVIKFQEKHASDILEPLELKKGTGFVGPSTRGYLEKIIKTLD